MPELAVGADEFTLVLRPTKEDLEKIDWEDLLGKMQDEFIRLSCIEKLYGLESTASKLQAGYTNGLTIVDRPRYFMMCWHDLLPTMGICVRFSAQAYAAYCRDYEKKYRAKMNVVVFLKTIKSDIYTMRLSRIDLVADYTDYPNPQNPSGQLDPNTLYDQMKKGRYVIRNYNDKKSVRTFSAIDNNGAYETFYAGSRKGKTDGFLRCYDKKQEQLSTNGSRSADARQCKSWVRFEAVYKGTYAHQITEQLLAISTEDELKQLVAKHISDKYQFFDTKTGDVLKITEDLAGIALGANAVALSNPSNRDNAIQKSIQYLKKNSGMFTIFYKVEDVWGTWGLLRLIHHLAAVYKEEYKPKASEKAEMKNWHEKHFKELSSQQLEDNFR